MQHHTLAGRLLATLAQVLEAGFYLNLLLAGAGLPFAFEALLAGRPAAAPRSGLQALPELSGPRWVRPVGRPRVRRRGYAARKH